MLVSDMLIRDAPMTSSHAKSSTTAGISSGSATRKIAHRARRQVRRHRQARS
jgi:hypothetical protein